MKRLSIFAALALIAFGVLRAVTNNTATLTWVAPTAYTDGSAISSPITYTVYQGAKGSPSKTIAQANLTGLTLTLSGLAPSVICWEVTATVAGQESAHSAEVCKSFLVPSVPTGVGVS